jgi:hypothetical protein
VGSSCQASVSRRSRADLWCFVTESPSRRRARTLRKSRCQLAARCQF